jgi:predicted amidophosphoribosyltransferase
MNNPFSLVRSALLGFAEIVLPPRCAGCGDGVPVEEPFCARCLLGVEAVDGACPRCALPLPPSGSPVAAPCLGCLRAPPPWRTARAPYAFAGEVAIAIRRWKLGGDATLTRPLAQLLAPSLPPCDALVPVPLHPRRLRARGFNQSALLARAARRIGLATGSPLPAGNPRPSGARKGPALPPPAFASLTAPGAQVVATSLATHDRRAERLEDRLGDRLPPVEELLDRVLDTPPQSHLDAPARRANLRRAFALRARASAVRGRHLCLVDDVLTTGATAEACARVLLRAGARRVDVLTLARTLP